MMKRLLLLILIMGMGIFGYAQKLSVKGIVVDANSGSALAGLKVKIAALSTTTDESGNFSLSGLSNSSQSLEVSGDGFETLIVPVNFAGKDLDLGKISVKTKAGTEATESGVAEVSLSSYEVDDESKDQNISGVLHSTNDIFVSTASYTFGGLYFRMRGYDSENQSVYVNGVPANDPENGRASWSDWGGLNDATRMKEYVNGIDPPDFSFGNLNGAYNIITRASLQRKQTKFSYALTNRMYRDRIMFTYSTGQMKNGWAVTASGSRRWAQEGNVEGTFYDSWAYFLAVEKKINDHHSIAFTGFGTPTRRGQQGGSTQEVYDLSNNNFYNPNWGYQNGEKRNAKVKTIHEPMMILNHYFKIDDRSKLTTSLGYSFGKTGATTLNWYNAADPRPDYYRYLPSYATDPLIANEIAAEWKANSNVSQINWDALYQVNYLANIFDKQANYIVESNVISHNQYTLTSVYDREINEHITFKSGLELSNFTGRHYKVLDDLLGGKYWVDIDQFAQRDFKGDTATLQNDMNNPNRIIKEGDKFGYDYNIVQKTANYWAHANFSYRKFDVYTAFQLSYNQFYREGFMKNGRHPENSYGTSKKHNFTDYSLKVGGTYKITGRQYLNANLLYMTRAPFTNNIFISPRTSDAVVPDLKSEKILSGDISYVLRYPNFNARITAYQTMFSDQTEINRFYHDDLLTFVNQSMYGIKKTHQGVEIGAEAKVSPSISVVAVASLGNFIYTNRPQATTSYDNGSKPDTTETIYCKNFYVAGTPQTATSIGLKYFRNYWFGNLNLNYFDKSYLDFNPERRTTAAITNLGSGDPLIKTITEQQKLSHGFTIDASVGKSWRFKGYYVNLNFSISNLLDNTDLITGGYEQLRFDFATKNVDKFPNKYYYYYGRTYFISLGIRI